MIKLLTILGFLMMASCNSEQRFDREHQLNMFLHAHGEDTLDKSKKYVFIYNNVQCNSCFMGLFDSLNTIFQHNQSKKILIFTHLDTSLLENARRLPNQVLFYDTTKALRRLGLAYSTDLLVKYNHGRSTGWAEISFDNLDEINKLKEE